jgi:hypothetical protein
VAQVRCGQLQTDGVASIPRGITWLGKKIAALTRPEQRYARIRDSSQDLETFSKTRSGGPNRITIYRGKTAFDELIHICRLG